jgi:hypothetical protein
MMTHGQGTNSVHMIGSWHGECLRVCVCQLCAVHAIAEMSRNDDIPRRFDLFEVPGRAFAGAENHPGIRTSRGSTKAAQSQSSIYGFSAAIFALEATNLIQPRSISTTSWKLGALHAIVRNVPRSLRCPSGGAFYSEIGNDPFPTSDGAPRRQLCEPRYWVRCCVHNANNNARNAC